MINSLTKTSHLVSKYKPVETGKLNALSFIWLASKVINGTDGWFVAGSHNYDIMNRIKIPVVNT